MRAQAMRLRPVQSLKHVIETNGTVSAAAQSVTDLAKAVDAPAVSSAPSEVNIGATVSAIFINVQVIGVIAAGGVDNIYMYVFKNPGADLTLPGADAIGISDKRKFVLHQEMVMLTPFEATGTTGFPRTMFKGVVKIPRSYKRMGVKDKLQLVLQHRTGEATQTTRFCVEAIYKEFQ